MSTQHRMIRPTSSKSSARRSLSAPSPLRHTTRSNANVSSPSSLSRSSGRLSQSTHSHSDIAPLSSLPVLIHGKPKDTSWLELVDQLRTENADDYENASEKENVEDYMEEEDMRIRVVVRKRPLSSKEVSKSEVDVLQPIRRTQRIFVYQPRVRVDLTKEVDTQKFAFDNVFGEYAGNSRIYEETIKDLVPNVFDGNWSSVFAYGQTGSGKTFTMMGGSLTGSKAGNIKSTAGYCENFGLYYLAARDVFQYRQRQEYADIDIGVSLFEIYGGKLFDLLNDRGPVKCLEDRNGRVCFPGLTEHPVGSEEELLSMIEEGALNRSVGTTSANADSSRSHAVLQLSLRKTKVMRRKSINVEHGRLTFIDLAGSERGADTNKSSRTTRLEGAEINTSLLALKEVIRALAVGDSAQHIPFRGSKLTQVLKESFVGENCKAVMIACVAPNLSNCEHTLNTLRYADRVKERNPESRKPKAFVKSKNRRRSVNNSTTSAANRPSTAPPKPRYSVEINRRSILPSVSRISLCSAKDMGDKIVHDEAASCTSPSANMMKQNEPKMAFCTPPETSTEKEGWDQRDNIVLDDFFSSPSKEEDPIAVEDDSSHVIGEIMEDCKFNSIYSNSEYIDDAKKEEEAEYEVILKEAESKLLSSHREIMSNMLSMMKYEMSLVHNTDENREEIMNYVAELGTMQEKKLVMIDKLRDALSKYNALRSDIMREACIDKYKNVFLSDNCSDADFEDLRDSLGL
uniref:Kinesin-like protein n=1 Tax=Leptocylindrus danicus TaxID=163516 RepID=A0A7S2P4X6_9STRA